MTLVPHLLIWSENTSFSPICKYNYFIVQTHWVDFCRFLLTNSILIFKIVVFCSVLIPAGSFTEPKHLKIVIYCNFIGCKSKSIFTVPFFTLAYLQIKEAFWTCHVCLPARLFSLTMEPILTKFRGEILSDRAVLTLP